MFENFRNIIYSVVQDGLNAKDRYKISDESKQPNVNLYAGCEILEKYQKEWSEIHNLSEENAENAEKLDDLITTMQRSMQKRKTDITDLNVSLANIPTVVSTIQSCVHTMSQMERQFKEVENGLFQLENVIEILELQEKELEHRYQMALYKEKKLANLEQARVNLASKHSENVFKHEISLKKVQQERQSAFQEAFQSDLQQFKEAGAIPRLQTTSAAKRTMSLEEIQLDPKTEDVQALDDFLNK